MTENPNPAPTLADSLAALHQAAAATGANPAALLDSDAFRTAIAGVDLSTPDAAEQLTRAAETVVSQHPYLTRAAETVVSQHPYLTRAAEQHRAPAAATQDTALNDLMAARVAAAAETVTHQHPGTQPAQRPMTVADVLANRAEMEAAALAERRARDQQQLAAMNNAHAAANPFQAAITARHWDVPQRMELERQAAEEADRRALEASVRATWGTSPFMADQNPS